MRVLRRETLSDHQIKNPEGRSVIMVQESGLGRNVSRVLYIAVPRINLVSHNLDSIVMFDRIHCTHVYFFSLINTYLFI